MDLRNCIRYFSLIVLLFLLYGCMEPAIVFKEPQPEGAKLERFISPIYRGTYFCSSDSSIVYVKPKSVHKERAYSFEVPLLELDTIKEAELVGNTLYLEGFEEPIPVDIIQDTVYAEVLLQDTLFEIGPTNILKSFNGHQILNKRMDQDRWEVLILSLDDQLNLWLSAVILPEDIAVLEAITPVEDISREDQAQFRIAPSAMEFEEILKQRLIFVECDMFTRIKLPVEL